MATELHPTGFISVFFSVGSKPLDNWSQQILDDQNIRRRFHASTCQSTTQVKPFACMMPMKLDEGWNQIQFDLADFTQRAYGTSYVETVQIQINANCRLRRVYFCDRIYNEEELPKDYKLYLPLRPPSSGRSMPYSASSQV